MSCAAALQASAGHDPGGAHGYSVFPKWCFFFLK
jgi:hypothetical protein